MASAPTNYASSLIAALRANSANAARPSVPQLQFMPNRGNNPFSTGQDFFANVNNPNYLNRPGIQTQNAGAPPTIGSSGSFNPQLSGSSTMPQNTGSGSFIPQLYGNLMTAPEMQPMKPYVKPPAPTPVATPEIEVVTDESGVPVYYDSESGTWRRLPSGEGG